MTSRDACLEAWLREVLSVDVTIKTFFNGKLIDVSYPIKPDDGTIVNADRLKLNLYFAPIYKSKALKQLDVSFVSVRRICQIL